MSHWAACRVMTCIHYFKSSVETNQLQLCVHFQLISTVGKKKNERKVTTSFANRNNYGVARG